MAKVTIKVISKDSAILYHKVEFLEMKEASGERVVITYNIAEAKMVEKQNIDSKLVTVMDHINLIKIKAGQSNQNNSFTLLKEVNNNNFEHLSGEVVKDIANHFTFTGQKQLNVKIANIQFGGDYRECDLSSFIQKLTDYISTYNQDLNNHFTIDFDINNKAQKQLKYFKNRQENLVKDFHFTDSNIDLDLSCFVDSPVIRENIKLKILNN